MVKEFWWLSTKRMTVGVETEDKIIVHGAPIVWKFRGQHIKYLVNWMKKQPGFKGERISREES